MRKSYISLIFISFILTSGIWSRVPIYKEVYLFDPLIEYRYSTGLGGAYTLDLNDATNISLDFEISAEMNFTVIIDYCNFQEPDSIEERGLADLVYNGEKGDYNFFVLFVEDITILSKINSSIGYNKIDPNLTKHFDFNCSLMDGTPKVRICIYAGSYNGIKFHSRLMISYTAYDQKLRSWVWISSIAFSIVTIGMVILFILKVKTDSIEPKNLTQ